MDSSCPSAWRGQSDKIMHLADNVALLVAHRYLAWRRLIDHGHDLFIGVKSRFQVIRRPDQKSLKAGLRFVVEPHEILSFQQALLPGAIPIRNLNADKDADNDNDEVERDGRPVLGLHMLNDATQEH